MPTEPFKVFPQYKEIADNYYARLGRAKEEGKRIAWGVALCPSEVLRAMDLEVILGEPFGATCAAGGLAPELTAATEDYGFGRDFCSYSRNFVGAYLSNKSPLGEMPEADLMIGTKTGCNDHISWFETLSKMAGKPFFNIDVPALYEDVKEYHIAYLQAQMEKLVEFLEEVTGRKMEEEKLIQAVSWGHKARELWTKVTEYGMHVPSLLSFRSQLSFMLPAVSLRGTKEAVEFYLALLEEMEDRLRRGITAAEEEKGRLLWDNIPPWYYMQVFRYLDGRGAVIVVSPYVALFGINPPPSPALSDQGKELLRWKEPTSFSEALKEVVKDYLSYISVENLRSKLTWYEKVVKDYKVDAAFFHINRGCKSLSLNKLDIARHLEEKLNLPVLRFEGSNADPKDFDGAGTMAKIEAFLDKVITSAG